MNLDKFSRERFMNLCNGLLKDSELEDGVVDKQTGWLGNKVT